MEAGEGLHPWSKGARVKFPAAPATVSRGPVQPDQDLVAGFWLIKTKSLDEAIDWMKRAPFDGGDEIEIRQIFEPKTSAKPSRLNCASRKNACALRLRRSDRHSGDAPIGAGTEISEIVARDTG